MWPTPIHFMCPAPIKPQINLTVFGRVDVRVGTIESVRDIEGSGQSHGPSSQLRRP